AFMFVSASLGVLAKNKQIFYGLLFSQLVLGLGFGFIGMYITYKIDYNIWKKCAPYIFVFGLLATLAVFIPTFGWSHGGADRWIKLGPVSFQPVEILKFSFIIFFAMWLSMVKNKVEKIKFGILPLMILLSIIGVILLNQPDTKSFILMTITGLGMLFIAGVPLKQIISVIAIMGLVMTLLVFTTPYLQKRVDTFLNPANDARGSSWQVQQSQLAIGTGGILGRGYGQSIQKFTYLPEPQGDSVFAVVGEEFGFIGSVILILLYAFLGMRGLRIAYKSRDQWSRLLVAGIVIMVVAQSFMHIAAVVGVFPLTGVPLVFMSHGGTSLMIYLSMMGIILQISKFQKA
ncbi:MAG: putative lipid II flippase FtsW, partial [bacterium]|nr:putative lipid II flippase FtsW [bacterium]